MKRKLIGVILVFTILIILYWTKQEDDRIGMDKTVLNQKETTVDEIEKEQYKKDGIEAEYPKLISGGNTEDLERWNQMIYEDFNKILKIYSFNPFPELTPSPTNQIPTILTIKNMVKLNTTNLISIFYNADYNSKFSAHPTDLVYTTNIDKTNKVRLKLSDIIKLDKDFVKDFREWTFIPVEQGNEELNKAIKDYVDNISDEDLLMGFQTADNIGSGNLWGIYSYFTPDRLGISLEVPNYIGDHIEFEREYSKLKDFLK